MNPNIFPALRYRDADAAIAFLTDAFGFSEKEAYRGEDGVVHHAEHRGAATAQRDAKGQPGCST